MKTVIIFDQLDAALVFFVLDGDYRHLNGAYINQYTEDKAEEAKQNELSDLLYYDTGEFRLTSSNEFPTQAVREGAEVIVAGFLP